MRLLKSQRSPEGTVMPSPAGFTNELRELCRERCAQYGEPPCWTLPDIVEPCEHITPCEDCLNGAPIEH